MRSSRVLGLALALVLLGGCAGESNPPTPPTSTPSSASSLPSPSAQFEAGQIYLSLGDSYATGYRPADSGAPAGPSREGFAHLVARQTGLELVNLGCSGATSDELLDASGCRPANRALDAPDVDGQSQLDAAVEFLRANQGRVGLVTLVIGGNDLTPCARDADPLSCTSRAVEEIQGNLANVLPALRAAAGDTPIVGLTYPDVFLGAWVSPAFSDGEELARVSVPLFRNFFNTALATEYSKIDAEFVDVTAATGAYEPLSDTTQDPTYGAIPSAVAQVCALTFFCSHTDVHPTAAGHQVIADAVLAAVG